MVDSTASLRRKIGSAADLQTVVRAMKAQAAASVGQYEKSVAALGDYARTVELGLGVCFRQTGLEVAAAPQPGRHHGQLAIRAVVFGSDQGLVGSFNDTVLDHARAALPATAQIWAVGDRVHAAFADADVPPLGIFPVPASVQAIAALVGRILVTVIQEAADPQQSGAPVELFLFYNRPTSASAYAPVSQRLLPLDDAWHRELAQRPWPTGMLPEVLGSHSATMRTLIREYLFVSIFRACAESLASENSSRLAAMERADRNIDTMLVTLHDRYHRLRQDRIDEELSDVVSGFKALRLSGDPRHRQGRA
ncbi:MAG: F0F1 ATP synthase subunit gamma [Pseudomonadota bacterium]|nr:F0F1 ATP synthase subunit gamma [Pseudomonadota bacterium]